MNKVISILSVICCIATIGFSQSQQATIKIEKTENGETTVIEKNIELSDGQDINSILQELGVLDELGNLREGQSFEINVKKIDGPNVDQDITIEYFDVPHFNFELESKAFLGVILSENNEGNGVIVKDVIEDTQAEKVGIQPGDIIVSLDGTNYNSVSELVDLIGSYSAGDPIDIEVLRNGEIMNIHVDLGEKKISPFEQRAFSFDEFNENFEFPEFEMDEGGTKIYEFHMDDEDGWEDGFYQQHESDTPREGFLGVSPSYDHSRVIEKGVLIGHISCNSAAEKMGLKEGDVVIKIFKTEINTFDELADIIGDLMEGDEIKLTIEREGKKIKMSGNLGARPIPNCYKGSDMFQGHDFMYPENKDMHREFFFKFDGSDEELQLEGLEQQLEEMMRALEENEEGFNSEQLERELEEMLTPMLEEFEIVTEEININITIQPITDLDIDMVNENAQIGLSNKDDLQFDFVNFFPNPNNGEFNLRFQLQENAPYNVFIYNQIGKTVFEDSRSIDGEYSNTINLNGLADGPYFLLISQGEKTYSRKIIKE